MRESNVNFDELIKNIRNNSDLYQLIERMLIEGIDFSFDPYADAISLGAIKFLYRKTKNLDMFLAH